MAVMALEPHAAAASSGEDLLSLRGQGKTEEGRGGCCRSLALGVGPQLASESSRGPSRLFFLPARAFQLSTPLSREILSQKKLFFSGSKQHAAAAARDSRRIPERPLSVGQ